MSDMRGDGVDVSERLANQLVALQAQQAQVNLLREVPGLLLATEPPCEKAMQLRAKLLVYGRSEADCPIAFGAHLSSERVRSKLWVVGVCIYPVFARRSLWSGNGPFLLKPDDGEPN